MRFSTHSIDGLAVREYESFGSSQPVIFLHGGPGLYGYMPSLCESLTSCCRGIYYEQRGSKQGRLDVGVEDHVQDLRRVVQHFSGDTRPTVLGHSWGAMLAVLFAGTYPALLEKVVLVGCGPLDARQGQEFQEELVARFGDRRTHFDGLWTTLETERNPDRQQELADDYIEAMMPIYQMDPLSGEEIQPRHWDFQGGYAAMCESDEMVSCNLYESALSKITAPLTVIQGELDVLSPESLFPLVRTRTPQARTFSVAGAGHYPWAGLGREGFLKLLGAELRERTYGDR